jgi:hypothetical protein
VEKGRTKGGVETTLIYRGRNSILKLPRLLTNQTDGGGMRMMRRLRISIVYGLILTTGCLLGQDSDPDYLQWELAPMIVVYPGEKLTILTTAPLPAYQTFTNSDGSVIVYRSLWHAIGGFIERADDCMLVYHAPTREGVYLVYWRRGSERFGFFVKVNERGEGKIELDETIFEGHRGVFIPLTRADSAPVGLFLVNQRPQKPRYKPGTIGFIDNEGNYRIDPPDKPFFPGERPSCNGNRCEEVRKYDVQTIGYSKKLGTITITTELSLKLEQIGISHTRGATIDVWANITRTLHLDLIDCYRCENGQCKYVGSRVEYLVCEKVNNYTSPQWMCEAIRRWRERHRDEPLFPDFPPCNEPYTVDRNCVSGGECHCPPPSPGGSIGRGCHGS